MSAIKTLPIIIGHNDTLLNLFLPERGEGRFFFIRSDKGHIDLPRAREGGMAGGIFAIFVPPNPKIQNLRKDEIIKTRTGYEVPLASGIDRAYAQRVTISMMASLFKIEHESDGQVRVVRTIEDLTTCLHEDIFAAILHFEGAEAIDPELDALEIFYQAGLRSLGIVWSRPNAFAHGVPFGFPRSPDTGPGLTVAGRELVRVSNRLGIMLDLSHLNEQGFWDVAKLSDAPLVATHSNAHTLCPTSRNLTDKQLDAIKESQGIVGLNFAVTDLRDDGWNDADTPLEVMIRHIDYLVERLGIDCVGFGSDFDGATIPQEIGDASGLPNLVNALRESGYDDRALRKLAYENWVRVLSKTWK
ncbi:MAG TPA: dipeptidase [Ktedonobacteraceae bacterium]|nr:dipeptidase [Ktedonobacteraceae bacterium]